MREVEQILSEIGKKRASIKQIDDQIPLILNLQISQAQQDAATQPLRQEMSKLKKEVGAAVAELVRWPPHKVEHFAKLTEFFDEYPYEKSVFIMTKYPAKPPAALDTQLQNVIDLVRKSVLDCGFTPHLASDKRYHPELFKNIELYMLGCIKGIAIVESKHTQELNPNVTMEWGWLRSTARDVLFLIEKDFDRRRADIGGLIEDNFDWNDPEPGIKAGVTAFLT